MDRFKNVLFCNEGPLSVDENGNYYGRAFDNDFFRKYFYLGENLTICMRTRRIQSENAALQYTPIDLTNKRIVSAPNLLSAKGLLQYHIAFKLLEEEVDRADFVIVRVPSLLGNLAASIAVRKKKPYLADVVGCAWDIFTNYSAFGKLIAGYMYYAQKRTVYHADYALYVSSKFLQNRYPTKGVSRGISDVIVNEPDPQILQRRISRISNHSGKMILGTAAAVNVRFKGQEQVIRALGNMKKRGITCYEYQLVGGGNQDYLMSIAKQCNVQEQVVFLGSLPHHQVFAWLDSIDVYIQPSYTEGLSRSIVEAMSRATPCIVSDAGGNPELIGRDWVFPKKNSAGSIETLLCALEEQKLKDMAEENFLAAESFCVNRLEQSRKAFFDQILESR